MTRNYDPARISRAAAGSTIALSRLASSASETISPMATMSGLEDGGIEVLESRKRANEKWLKNNYEQIVIRVPKGTKAQIKSWAADSEMSMAAFIQAACREKSEKNQNKY